MDLLDEQIDQCEDAGGDAIKMLNEAKTVWGNYGYHEAVANGSGNVPTHRRSDASLRSLTPNPQTTWSNTSSR